MSLGSGIGGVVGGVLGFFIGGGTWIGALYGASLGFGAGLWIDPIKTNSNVAKPDTSELSVPTSSEGIPVPDALGITQASGNIFYYGSPRSEEVKEKTESGKGGGSREYVSGHKYFLTFAIGVLMGRIDDLYCIYENNNALWEAGTDPGQSLNVSSAVNGKVTLTVPDRGTIDFYFGTSDQTANATLTSETGYAIGYKNFAYAVFKDFMIGLNNNRVGALEFVFKKLPQMGASGWEPIGSYDYNPAYAAQYMLSNMAGIDSDLIDSSSFSSGAQTLYNENLGISLYCGNDSSILDYVESVFAHIRGSFYISTEGKLAFKLYRKDVAISAMMTIDEEDILEDVELDRDSYADTDNELVATYSKAEEESE